MSLVNQATVRNKHSKIYYTVTKRSSLLNMLICKFRTRNSGLYTAKKTNVKDSQDYYLITFYRTVYGKN